MKAAKQKRQRKLRPARIAKPALTVRQAEAIAWCKSAFQRNWKKRLNQRPEALPEGYRHFWAHPFGVPEWNEFIRIARRALWQGKVV